MKAETNTQTSTPRTTWNWERWLALLAFTVAALVRAGLFKHLPW